MGRYIQWQDVIDRYARLGDMGDEKSLESAYISYAEAHIESALAGSFTVPFSSNNITVMDLCIDAVMARISMVKNKDLYVLLSKDINDRIEKLLSGAASMATDAGIPGGVREAVIWSNTSGTHGSFGMIDVNDQIIDETLLKNEYDERGY